MKRLRKSHDRKRFFFKSRNFGFMIFIIKWIELTYNLEEENFLERGLFGIIKQI